MNGASPGARLAWALGASLLCVASDALGQDAPMVDAVGAYHHAQVMGHRDKTEAARAKKPQQGALTRRQLEALTANLSVEYGQRMRRDGKPAADRWLNARVAQLKARYTHTSD
jgi:hypothetical protein